MEQSLIDQVVARVIQKVKEAQSSETSCPQCACNDDSGKPGLLILTQEHGEHCHQMLESAKLGERYATKCALLAEYECSLEGVEAVILYEFTNDALSKLASGVCDTPYTELASKAILMGKRVYIPKEEVELFDYASTAPAVYYAMLEEKLRVLTASGVVICPKAELEDAVLQKSPAPNCSEPCCAAPETKPEAKTETAPSGREQAITKRAITEQDLFALKKENITRVRICENAILTDLAKEFVSRNGMTILRG